MKKMGVLGPLGTHSEAAAQYLSRLLPERPELLVYPDIFAVIQAVEDGEVDSCLVPVENSLEGAINITLDTLARSADLFVESELIWPVHNQLMARPGTQKICRIYSHPQPISQCRGYLQQHYPQAELIKDVHGIDDALRAIAGDSVSGLGTGGMGTKLQAADVACRAGIDTIIAAGSKPGVIGDVMEGVSVGTRFHAQASPLENRKRWIFGAPPAGEITVDEGATAAILERGSSLLPKGIKSVTGNFSRGEVIRICNLEGRDIAHGVTRYNSDALRRIAGHHSQQIDTILGYEYGPVAVHRDDMITR